EVLLIHRRPVFKASNIMLERAKKNPKIKFMVPYATTELKHDATGLKGIVVENLETKKKETIEIEGFFMAIGHTPNSKIFAPYVDMDAAGYIKVENTKTKTPGVYAAGDISDPTFRQAVTAAGMGCQAAILAIRYLEEHD